MLSTEKSVLEKDPLKYIWMIYGEHGIGKTTMCSQMQDPYFIATEPGHKFHRLFKTDVVDWAHFQATVDELTGSQKQFKTVVIDTITEAWNLCVDAICFDRKWDHVSEGAQGKGYDLAKAEFRRTIMKIPKKNLGLVFVAHRGELILRNRGDERSKLIPDMMKTCRNVVLPLADMVGYMYADTVLDKEKGAMDTKRFITFAPNPDVENKDRSGLLAASGRIMVEPVQKCWETISDKFKGA